MSPATWQEMELHQCLLQGDETVSAKAFDRYVNELAEHLVHQYPVIVAHNGAFVDEVVADVLFDYIACPEKYDPQQKCLGAYLRMAAGRDLLNRWRQVSRAEKAGKLLSFEEIEEREFDTENGALCYLNDWDPDLAATICQAWQIALAYMPGANPEEIVKFLDNFVELGQKSGNRYIGGSDSPAQQASGVVLLQSFWWQVQALAPDVRERAVMVLLMSGVRETAIYVKALAITHLTVAEQTNQVKQVKDKLKKRLQRADWKRLTNEVQDAE